MIALEGREFTYDGPKMRIDLVLVGRFPDYSRAYFQRLIRHGRVLVNGQPIAVGDRIAAGDGVLVALAPRDSLFPAAEDIALEILHEDEDLIVVNKPAGLVVHPAYGHPGGTLVNALLHRYGEAMRAMGEERPGLVHRLDRDTSGVLVVARHARALSHLSREFEQRRVQKTYLALVQGEPRETEGEIEAPVARDPANRQKMAVGSARARHASSSFTVTERFGDSALLEVRPHTGRTHQIRVHLKFIGHPVVGDVTYGGGAGVRGIPVARPLLHAWKLGFLHPGRRVPVSFEAPLPEDFRHVLNALRS